MPTTLVVALFLTGTVQPGPDVASATVAERAKQTQCFRVDPQAIFQVTGKANAKLMFWIDLPEHPKRPQAIELTLDIDGTKTVKKLKPKRGKKVAYESESDEAPSKRLKPIRVKIAKGEHQLTLILPLDRTGCVAFKGIELIEPAPAVAVATDEAEPDVAAESAEDSSAVSDAEAPETAETTETAVAAEAGVAEPPDAVAATEPGDQSSADPPQSSGAVTEIKASAVDLPATADPVETIQASAESPAQDLLRLGVKGGGQLPRGDLRAGFSVLGVVELPLVSFGTMGLELYLEGGWSPMRSQNDVLIPGRGRAQLIQESLVLPFEIGPRLRIGLGSLAIYIAAGLAVDVMRTKLRAFSTSEVQENDVALGAAGALGVFVSLGPGGLLVEARYREVRADLGEFDAVAEDVLGGLAMHLGYVVAIAK